MWSDLILFWACWPHLAGEVSLGLYCTTQCDTALPLACSTQHNWRVIEGNQYSCLWSKNYFLLRKNPAFFQFLVYFRERKCHESCISQLLFFRVKTQWVFHHAPVYRFVYQGYTSRQITCLRNYRRRPMGWLAQQSTLCHAAIADQYWKN